MSINSHRRVGRSPATTAEDSDPHGRAKPVDPRLDEVEAVARIGSYETDLAARRWVSSRGLDAIFGIDAAFDRSVEGWASLVHPDDRQGMLAYLAEDVLDRGRPFDKQYRIVRADTGEERWVHGRGQLELDGSGRPLRMLGTIADITDQRRAQEMLIRSELRYATIFEGALEAILIAEQATLRFRWVNAAASALLGYTRDELSELTVRDIHPPDALPAILERFEAALSTGTGEGRSIPCLRKDGTVLLADIKAAAAEIDGVSCLVGFFSEVTELRRIEARDRKLAQAIEQTSDPVIITDLAGTIEYVNPAFERVSGYGHDEAVGASWRILKSGRQSAGFYRALSERLTSGRAWSGTLINRRKDGAPYEAQTTISPIRGPGGQESGYVAVARDVTAERAAESALAAQFRERAQVAATLARLQPGPTAEATAAAICAELLALPGIDVPAIFDFPARGRAVTLAAGGPDGLPFVPGRALSRARATYLFERAELGPWAETWQARPEDGQYGLAIAELGIKAVAYAPIRSRDGLVGLLAAGTCDAEVAQHLIDHFPVVGEFAVTAGALLGHQLDSVHRSDLAKRRIGRVLATRAFHPVFQPIVELGSATPVGYEALTRFTDGTPPDRMIAEAHSVGLGRDLEVACVTAAVAAAEALLPGVWLSLNVSPQVILHSEEFAGLVAGQSRRIVIEVTEHTEIEDYEAVRRAVVGLGPTVSLAVDDAGAGFGSLRHVVELRPRFLKLDVSLIRGVDRDLTRQAMIAGLAHFASRSSCEVIAEGIEEPAELEMLRELGVPLGQGYLLGRPEPLPAASGSAGRPGPATPVRRSVGKRASSPGSTPRRRAASQASRSA